MKMEMYAAIAAALAGLGLGNAPRKGRPSKETWHTSQPSEVAHLSKKERLKRRRIHRLSTRKR